MIETSRCIYEFGPFRVDAIKRLLLNDGKQIRLPAKAFDILLLMLEGNGRLIEKDELMRRVWPDSVVEENNLTVNISALRKSLAESPGEHRYVVTVPGRGYQFVADVLKHDGDHRREEVVDLKAERVEVWGGNGKTDQPSANRPNLKSSTSRLSRTSDTAQIRGISNIEYIVSLLKRHKHLAVFALVALIGTIFIAIRFGQSGYLASGSNLRKDSIVVLPFANLSSNPDSDYLSDGISESLINSLSELRGVKVIASNSSFRYKNKKIDFQNVAAELGVEEIVTGRVLQRGETLIISVELINGRDGTHLWGEQYERKRSEVFELQSEVSKRIAENLRSRLNPNEQPQLARPLTVNPQAYEMFLKGQFFIRKQEIENKKKAVEYYQQAIDIDPGYALAYAELSASYLFLYGSGLIDPKEFRPKSEAAAYKALQLDDGLAQAHSVLAALKENDWEWATAEREYRRALELNPNLAEAYHFYSFYLMVRGRYDEAVGAAERARELDPLSLMTRTHVAVCLNIARRYDEAIELNRKILELDSNFAPAHYVLADSYAGKGMYRESIAEHLESIRTDGGSPTDQIYMGAVYARAGERKKALKILKQLETSKEYVSPGELSVLYAALGERDQAFASLEKAYVAHDLQLQYLGADSSFDSLRDDVRFKDLMHRVGLS